MAANFVFTGAQAPARSRLDGWVEHARRVTGVDLRADDVAGPAAVWHLAAANYRVLARSVEVFRDPADAAEDALGLGRASDDIRVRLVKSAALGAYGWYLAVDDEPRATCARWYATERDRRDSIRLALSALTEALPALELDPRPRARMMARAR